MIPFSRKQINGAPACTFSTHLNIHEIYANITYAGFKFIPYPFCSLDRQTAQCSRFSIDTPLMLVTLPIS